MMKSALLALLLLCAVALLSSSVDGFSDDPSGQLMASSIRQDRSAKPKASNKSRGGPNANGCRYSKGSWGECDEGSNQRSRTLTLKRGDAAECQQTKIETRKCKKPCRYTRGQWTVCNGSDHMKERIDQLKSGSDASCEATKRTVKKCKGKNEKKQQQHHGR